MLKRLILLYFIILSITFGCGGGGEQLPTGELNGGGNSQNLGLAVTDGYWAIYDYVVLDPAAGLYRTRLDGSGETGRLSEVLCTYISIVDGWVYCAEGTGIIRMLPTGEKKQMVYSSGTGIKNLVYLDGYFYFVATVNAVTAKDSGKIMQVSLNGLSARQINSDNAYVMNIVGTWIFYRNADDDKLYRVNTDGSGKIKLSDDMVDDLIPYGGLLFYRDYTRGSVAVMNYDGTAPRDIITTQDGEIDQINISEGYLYFSRNNLTDNTKKGIFRVYFDGSGLQPIKTGTVDYNVPIINIVWNKIYAVNIVFSGSIPIPTSYYRMNKDGTGYELLWGQLN